MGTFITSAQPQPALVRSKSTNAGATQGRVGFAVSLWHTCQASPLCTCMLREAHERLGSEVLDGRLMCPLSVRISGYAFIAACLVFYGDGKMCRNNSVEYEFTSFDL